MSKGNLQARLVKQEVPFTQIPNNILNDNSLCFALKGLFSYIQSKKDGWEFSAFRIAKDTKESKTTIKRMLSKLIKTGHLIRHKHQTGKITYSTVFEPKCQIATVPNSHGADLEPLSNTNSSSNTDSLNNKDKREPSKVPLTYTIFNSAREGDGTFLDSYLKAHDKRWKEKHRSIKNESLEEYNRLLETLCYGGFIDEDSIIYEMAHYQNLGIKGDHHYPVFCLWLFSEVSDRLELDYRGFNCDGSSMSVPQMIECLEETYA